MHHFWGKAVKRQALNGLRDLAGLVPIVRISQNPLRRSGFHNIDLVHSERFHDSEGEDAIGNIDIRKWVVQFNIGFIETVSNVSPKIAPSDHPFLLDDPAYAIGK